MKFISLTSSSLTLVKCIIDGFGKTNLHLSVFSLGHYLVALMRMQRDGTTNPCCY